VPALRASSNARLYSHILICLLLAAAAPHFVVLPFGVYAVIANGFSRRHCGTTGLTLPDVGLERVYRAGIFRMQRHISPFNNGVQAGLSLLTKRASRAGSRSNAAAVRLSAALRLTVCLRCAAARTFRALSTRQNQRAAGECAGDSYSPRTRISPLDAWAGER